MYIERRYIVDESNRRIAVQLDMDTFEKIEEALENYGLVQLIDAEDPDDEIFNIEQAKAYYASLEKTTTFYVGRERHGCFQPGLQQGCAYGQWRELGAPHEGVFNLYYTKLPRAHTGELRVGESGLQRLRLDLSGDLTGQRVFARATGPEALDLCTASAGAAIDPERPDNLRSIVLG